VCLGETKSLLAKDALLTAKEVLSGAWRSGGRFGTGYVVNLLIGRADERMKRNGHDTLQVFGILKESGEAAVRSWIDQLIVQGFLEVVEEREYPLLRITEAGKALCRDVETVRLGVPASPAMSGKKKPKSLGRGISPDLSPDEELFDRLRRLRRLISEKLGVPPYVVFHDSALIEMAAIKPRTLDALRGVKGVGERKIEHYGAAFLEVISGKPSESAAIIG
jgi:ATP-dependent DNA helicase RecQ